MADILHFKKPKAKIKSRGLCQHGVHKWKVWNEKQFDVKQGKLITVYRCTNCGKQRVKSH